jgi:hypothetical protein
MKNMLTLLGIFQIGMDSEFAVYSQWRGREETAISNADTRTSNGKDFVDHRHLPEKDLLNMAQVCPHSFTFDGQWTFSNN